MKRALFVIDVQNEYFDGAMPVSYPQGSFPNILRAMDAAASAGIPVCVIQHTAPDGQRVFQKNTHSWELHPEVARRPRDKLIEKRFPGSFTGTPLHQWLESQMIDRIVITGYMTQMCCDTTARQACHEGYPVEFLSDATGTLACHNAAGSVSAEQLHTTILVVQASRFSEVLTTDQWIARIAEAKS